jgi:carboxylate-amine ligase
MRSLTAEELRARFERSPSYLVGLEDEVMLLDPGTLALAHRAPEVLALVDGDPRFKLELPASQLELQTQPCKTVAAASNQLLDARRDLSAATMGSVVFAAAGAHPFSPPVGELNDAPRYRMLAKEYGCLGQRELVCALQVHVSPGDADRALAVYNCARSYLPYLAALAANAPFYRGVDTGLASVRPKIAELLPRQGIPPSMDSWETYANTLAWGATTGTFADPGSWWWELRLHPEFGTLEFRVPDSQSTVATAAAIGAVAQALVAWLGERHDAGEKLAVHPAWKIDQNRWSACRDGVEGTMVELETNQVRPTRELLGQLFAALVPVARRLRSARELELAVKLVEVNGAIAQRQVARHTDIRGVAAWLAERFLAMELG